MLQLTCRDRNRIALQSDLLSAAALGVRNLLMLQRRRPQAPATSPTPSRCSISIRASSWRPRAACATPANCRPGARFPAAPISSSARPTIRSIRRPAGSRKGCKPRSTPARNSCRRSSAWMPAWCAATWRGSPSTASPASCRSSIGIVAAALGQVGALDQGKAVRRHYPGRNRRAACKAPAIRRRKAAASASTSCANSPTSRSVAGVPYHGARQRRRRAGHHQGGARDNRAAGGGVTVFCTSP